MKASMVRHGIRALVALHVMVARSGSSVSELDRGGPRPPPGAPPGPTRAVPPRAPPPGGAHHGATSVEYALVAGLIAVVIVAAVTLFGRNVITLFNVPTSVFNP